MMADLRPVVGIIQARMGSTRLPEKSLHRIEGKPLLSHVIERMRACRTIDSLMLATTCSIEDRQLLALAEQENILSYAGSVENVLDRYYQAAKISGARTIVRITADDPFKDPQVVDQTVQFLFEHAGEMDYVSNTIHPTYPEGLDIEVFTFRALEIAWKEATLPSEREHVTPYIWKHPQWFHTANLEYHQDLSHLRWTVDYPEDMVFVRAVYQRLYRPGKIFLMKDILALLEKEPELASINQGFQRNAGYLKSLKTEQGKQ